MASRAPIFPVPETQHYSDYGFDPQIDYYQALHEARRQHGKREAARHVDAFRFKLQKPISKDDSRRGGKSRKRGGGGGGGRWWRNALLFWKRRGGGGDRGGSQAVQHRATAAAAPAPCSSGASPCYYGNPYQGAASPLYMADSGDAEGWTPCRSTSGGDGEGTCLGSLRLTGWGEVKVPYLCLRDLAARDASLSPSSAAACPSPAMPIYLVT